MVPGDVVTARDLGFLVGAAASRPAPPGDLRPLHEARDRFERDYIVQALAAHAGNVSRTAEALRVERSNLHRKMRAFGITSPAPGEGDPCCPAKPDVEDPIRREAGDAESLDARRGEGVGRDEADELGAPDLSRRVRPASRVTASTSVSSDVRR